jgi:inosine-uridine nucleoside N-ribohydrolase
MYIQGGFAGCNLVASENVLPKFKNKTEVRTFNFNCDKEAALYVLNSKQVVKRHLVAKNVCHGTLYDESLHVSLYNAANLSFGMMEVVNGMAKYGNMLKMKKRPFQKMLHDPLMALTFMCSLKGEKLCEFAEVNLLLNGDKWSSERANGTNTFISIACDYDRFYKKLFELK